MYDLPSVSVPLKKLVDPSKFYVMTTSVPAFSFLRTIKLLFSCLLCWPLQVSIVFLAGLFCASFFNQAFQFSIFRILAWGATRVAPIGFSVWLFVFHYDQGLLFYPPRNLPIFGFRLHPPPKVCRKFSVYLFTLLGFVLQLELCTFLFFSL